MTRPLLLIALLALAAAGTLDVFGPDGQRLGVVREGPGGRVDVFDAESRRIGWGRCGKAGNCELFDMRGNRIGTVTQDGTIRLQFPLQKEGKKR